MSIAVYAGSFDPITNGHLWVIDKAAVIFENLIIAVGNNPDKKYSFTVEERLDLLNEILAAKKNIKVDHFSGEFLVNYAHNIGAKFIVRGIRNANDYEYEKAMRYVNSDLCNDIDTIFLMPPRNYAEVSSSLVKDLAVTQGWESVVNRYVPAAVLKALKVKVSCFANDK